mgnify:CR=1 FL=1
MPYSKSIASMIEWNGDANVQCNNKTPFNNLNNANSKRDDNKIKCQCNIFLYCELLSMIHAIYSNSSKC